MTRKKHRSRPSGGQSVSTSDIKFKSPTPGLEYMKFTHRTSMAAAEFSEVQSKLSRYVGSKVKGAMGAKVIMNLTNPNLTEPIPPIRVMKKVQLDGVDTDEDSTVPVMNDILFNFEMGKDMIIWKSWNLTNESWA